MTKQRRLAAILVADVVGYSKLVGTDEEGTLAQLQSLRTEILEPQLAKHAGRLFKSVGDGFLIEFSSAVQAVSCAKAIQETNALGKLPLRIGVHLGDVVVQGDDLMGDGVNIAARIESIAETGGIAISRQVRDQVRDKLDVELIDKGEVELKNIARPVRVFMVGGAKSPNATPALALPDKPSIAVLPFQNMSGDPEQEYFADGISEDIITELTRFRSLFVIARNSSFSYKGKSPDVRQVGRELGVRYVLEGSVRKAGDRIRLTGQLIDAQTGSHIWAERYDRKLDDVFAVQEELTRSIVTAIAPHVSEAELGRIKLRKIENLTAYELAVRANATAWNAFVRSDAKMCDEALGFATAALEIDADNLIALSARALAQFQHIARATAPDPGRAWRDAMASSERALQVDRSFSNAYVWKGLLLLYAPEGARFEEGLASARQGHDMNPHDMTCLIGRAFVETMAGDPERSLELLEEALRLSPRDPLRPHLRQQFTMATFHAGRFEECISHACQAIAEAPRLPPPHAFLAASYAALKRYEEAKSAFAAASKAGPEYVQRILSGFVVGRGLRASRLRELLRLAGGLDDSGTTPLGGAPPRPSALSLVVLPFANLSNDPEQEFFADGLTEDLTTDLSRLSGSFVIARNTAFTFKGKPVDVKRIGSELGVRYVLEGSVRKMGERVRLNAQLIDSETGAHLWAERFDHDQNGLLALQDEITGRIANALRVTLIRSAAREAERLHSGKPEAVELLMRARAIRQKPSAVDSLQEARGLYEQALEADPGLIDAWSGLAYILSAMALNFPDQGREADLARADQAVARALALDRDHADSHFSLGRIRLAEGRLAEAAIAFETTLALDRNHASAHTQLGLVRNFQGAPAEAVRLCQQAIRLSPRDPLLGNWQMFVGAAYALLGEDRNALNWLQRAVANNPGFYLSQLWLAAAQWLTGDKDAARASVEMTLKLRPALTLGSWAFREFLREPAYLRLQSRVDDAWRQAGLPE